MDTPNAFISQKVQPTAAQVAKALGPSADAWNQLIDWLVAEHRIDQLEWKSISPKYGWSLRPKLKKRIIVHLSPCNGCFRIAFIFGDRAVQAAANSGLSKATLKALAAAPHYPEGTGLRLTVKGTKDLPAIRKLAALKLAY